MLDAVRSPYGDCNSSMDACIRSYAASYRQIQANRSAPAPRQSASFCKGLKLQQIIPVAVPDVLPICRRLLHR